MKKLLRDILMVLSSINCSLKRSPGQIRTDKSLARNRFGRSVCLPVTPQGHLLHKLSSIHYVLGFFVSWINILYLFYH